MTKIAVIPDIQAKDGVDFTYLTKIGQYLVDKKPDIIVCLGDLADMPSLSSYDQGKRAFEGRRYTKDVDAALEAQDALFDPITSYNYRQFLNKKKTYSPRTVMLLGNHENRIDRAINNDAKLEGLISTNDLGYAAYWQEIYPFLQTVVIEGVAFSHYFVTGVAGRPAASAGAQFNKTNMSCIAGHQQGLQVAMRPRADGARLTSIIAGSCYEHDEDYMGPQGNKHWRGFLMLHGVDNGEFDLVTIPLKYINEKYA